MTGRTVLLTGAGGGFGQAIGLELASAGAKVVALDRTMEAAEAARDGLLRGGAENVVAIVADVASADSVARAFAQIDAEVGPIDALVNNAGVREIKSIFEITAAEWDRVIAIDLSGPFYCAREAAPRMRANGGGAIVNIASVAGLVGFRHRPAYTSAKHGLVGLTKNLAIDLAEHGIRVNAIAPGSIPTPLTAGYFEDAAFLAGLAESVPLQELGSVADVAKAVRFLLSDDAAFITGVTIPVDGGFLAEKAFAGRAARSFFRAESST